MSSSIGEPEKYSLRTENFPSISDKDFSELSEKIEKSVCRRIKDTEVGQREILKMIENLSSKIDSLSDKTPLTTNAEVVESDLTEPGPSSQREYEQTAEYPRQNHRARGTPSPLSQNERQSESEVEDPRPIETATTNMQYGSPTGAENDTPPQDEPQSYPTAQIAEYLTRDPVTNEQCIPIFSAVTLKKKKKMLFAPMDFQDLTLDALIDSSALVNCISETDYSKIFQMSPTDIVKELEPPPSNFKSQMATSKHQPRQSSSNSK